MRAFIPVPLALLLTTTAGCEFLDDVLSAESDGPSYGTLLEVCQRFADCGMLVYESVSECADDASVDFDDLTVLEAALCETELNDCLALETCDAFAYCDISLCLL